MSIAPWPQFDADQIAAATRVLASGRVNVWTGQETQTFEQNFAAWCGSSHAIAMANGSLALSAAYLAIGLGKGDELVNPAHLHRYRLQRSFARCQASLCRLILIQEQLLLPLLLAHHLRTKAIVVAHLGGWPFDMPAICDWPVLRHYCD